MILFRSTSQRPDARTARARTAKSIPNTKSHNTKPARYDFIYRPVKDTADSHRQLCSRKESVVMIASSPVTVAKRNPCSTRRQRQQRKSC
jgi:hypothetical protein